MQLSDLKQKLSEELGLQQVASTRKEQMFGFIDNKHVSFCGIDYSIETSYAPDMNNTVAPALIYDDWKRPGLEKDDEDYATRRDYCDRIHHKLLEYGYVLLGVVRHSHTDGDMVQCEYFKPATEDPLASSLRVIYAPTVYEPEGVIIVTNKHGKKTSGVYYTVGYEEGQITFLGASDFDGTQIRTIEIKSIDGHTWRGKNMSPEIADHLEGLGIDRITSYTQSESPSGWSRQYTGTLWFSDEPVEITIRNYHTTV